MGGADSACSELFIEVSGSAEYTTQLFYVLAHDEDFIIAPHFFLDDLADCLCVSHAKSN